MKRTKVLLFSLVLVMFALIFSGVEFKAAEVATSSTISVKGAQVRTSDPVGIRFVGTAEGEYDAYGIAIAFGDVDVNQVVLGATINGKAVLSAEATEKDGDGQFYISLISIPEDMYVQDVTARAYVKNGEDVTYATTAAVRNLAEVTLAVKNAGGEVVESVLTSVEANYKKVFVDQQKNVHIDNAVFESNTDNLAKEFIKDWNAMFETSLDVATAFEGSANAPWYKSAKTNSQTDWTSSKLKEFFQEEKMSNKWGWLLNYVINEMGAGTGYDFAKAQANAIATGTADAENWYYGAHLCSFMMSIFAGAYRSSGWGSFNFAKNPAKLGTIVNYNNKIYSSNVEFVKVGENCTLPTYNPGNGYMFTGYTNGNDYYYLEYTVTENNDLLYPQKEAEKYMIYFYDGNEMIGGMELTYNIESPEIVLPTPVKDGLVFVDWYTNPEFTGDPVEVVPAGSYGDKKFYAKFSAGAVSTITFDYMDSKTAAEIVAEFVADVKSYSTSSNEEKFLTATSTSYNNDYLVFTNALSKSDGTFGAKWSWLFNYIADAQATITNTYAPNVRKFANEQVDDTAVYVLCQELKGLRDNIQATKYYSAVMYDWSVDSANIKSLIIAASKSANKTINLSVGNALETPVSTREGYTFDGWYTTSDYQAGTKVTTVPNSSCTLYAKWVKAGE